jgi:hypothetical protein
LKSSHHVSQRARGSRGWRWPAPSRGSRSRCPGSFVSAFAPQLPRRACMASRHSCSCGARAPFGSSNGPTRASGPFALGQHALVIRQPWQTDGFGWESGTGFCGSKPRPGGVRCWWKRRPEHRALSGASAGACMATCAEVPGAPGSPLLPSGPRFEVRHAPLKIIRLDKAQKETFAGVQGLFSSKGAGVLL